MWKNEASGMISFVCRARKHVSNGTPDDRSDDAKHDRPEDRYMHVHHRFRAQPPRLAQLEDTRLSGTHFFLHRLPLERRRV